MATEQQLKDALEQQDWCEVVVRSEELVPNAPGSVKEEADMTWKTVYFYEAVGAIRKERKHQMLIRFAGDVNLEDARWENSEPAQSIPTPV